MKRTFDTLGFLSPQGQPPIADPELHEHLDGMLFTPTPPFVSETEAVINGVNNFPGLIAVKSFLETQPNLKIAETAEDLANREGKTAIILGLQQTPHDIDPVKLQELHKHGVRVMTLAYQEENHPLGSGYINPDKPLTTEGRNFLEECANLGMIVDLSHVGHQTARDVLDFKDQEQLDLPVIASHGGVYELFDGTNPNSNNNLRNLPLEVLQRIAEAKGLVGIYALTFGLSETDDSLAPFLNQIIEASTMLGSTALTIGTDSVYKKRDPTEWEATVRWLTDTIAKTGELEPRYPDIPFDLNRPDKLSLIAQELTSTGMPQGEVSQIVGENAFKFFTQHLPK